MKRRRTIPWRFLARWTMPVMVGLVTFSNGASRAFGLADTTDEGWLWTVLGFHLFNGVLWAFLVWQYGTQQARDREHTMRWDGQHPPTEVYAVYDGHRFENLPTHYLGIRNGLEVWEVMLPKAGHPDEVGAKILPAMTTITMHIPEEES